MAEAKPELKRRRWRRLVFLALLLCAPALPWPLPRAELIGAHVAAAPVPGAPALFVPRADAANPLRAVFVSALPRGGHEVTLWFSDEDHPWAPVDHAYDLYRYFAWGRVDDLETFRITPEGMFNLDGVAAGEQGFGVLWAEHQSGLVGRGGPPRLYVRTWNHLLSPDPEPGVDYVQAKVPWLTGSRAELEAEAQR